MADSYTHRYSARKALDLANYKPRDIDSFVLGSNGPDPLFFYQMYNPFKKYHMSKLGSVMHTHKTGLFLKNMFRFAQTDTQKDYCLGFLCHYSMDSLIHPFVYYITQAYGSPYNISAGHSWFESALDSKISVEVTGQPAPQVEYYCPDMSKMQLEQIATLFKKAVDATYEDFDFPRSEYVKAFRDLKIIKNFFYSPNRSHYWPALMIEKIGHFEEGYVVSKVQPCIKDMPDMPFWKHLAVDLYTTESLDDIINHANYLSARCIGLGLEYFNGMMTVNELAECLGNKSYETGVTVD